MADFQIINFGSVVRFEPLSEAAVEWVDDHVEVPDYAWSGAGFVADWRPAQDLLNGLEAAGFELEAA